jgi:thymidylate kinase
MKQNSGETNLSKRFLCVGGAAGTGKTSVIKEMQRIGGDSVAICTASNYQATNFPGGATCHSRFGCTPTKVPSDANRFKKLAKKKVVIVDESQQVEKVSSE